MTTPSANRSENGQPITVPTGLKDEERLRGKKKIETDVCKMAIFVQASVW